MKFKSILVLVLLLAPRIVVAQPTMAQQNQQPAIACPACKVVIDVGALRAAAADLGESSYAYWEALLVGLESGAFTWEEIRGDVDQACKWAEEARKWSLQMEERIRVLSMRPTTKK